MTSGRLRPIAKVVETRRAHRHHPVGLVGARLLRDAGLLPGKVENPRLDGPVRVHDPDFDDRLEHTHAVEAFDLGRASSRDALLEDEAHHAMKLGVGVTARVLVVEIGLHSRRVERHERRSVVYGRPYEVVLGGLTLRLHPIRSELHHVARIGNEDIGLWRNPS